MGFADKARKFFGNGKEGTTKTDLPPNHVLANGRAWMKDELTGKWEPVSDVFGEPEHIGVNEKTGQVYLPTPYTPINPAANPAPLAQYNQCHAYGPIEVMTIPSKRHDKGIKVYAGAGREVDLQSVDGVIDLCGFNSPMEEKKGRGFNRARNMLLHQKRTFYIHIPTVDGGAPRVNRAFWEALLEDIQADIQEDILVCCTGGHGRTGLALVILACLAGVVPDRVDPVDFIRNKYCVKAVESDTQLIYIEKITKRVTKAEPSDWAGTLSKTTPAGHYGSFSGTRYDASGWDEGEVDRASEETAAVMARLAKETT